MFTDYVSGSLIFAGVAFSAGIAVKGLLKLEPHAIFLTLLTMPGLIYAVLSQNHDKFFLALVASGIGLVLGQCCARSYWHFARTEMSVGHRMSQPTPLAERSL